MHIFYSWTSTWLHMEAGATECTADAPECKQPSRGWRLPGRLRGRCGASDCGKVRSVLPLSWCEGPVSQGRLIGRISMPGKQGQQTNAGG